MNTNLQEMVADIRKDQLTKAVADYTEHLHISKLEGFDSDEDDFYLSYHSYVALHFTSLLATHYAEYLLQIRNEDADALRRIQVLSAFDLYYSLESDISTCFMTDLILAQHTMAQTYRIRAAIADYILSDKELVRVLDEMPAYSFERVDSVTIVKDALKLMGDTSGISVPLFSSPLESVLEFKLLVKTLQNVSQDN